MKETELKPCSCGCEAELVDSQAFSWCNVTYYVRCTNPDCDERTELKYEHKIDAINAWNKKQEFLLPLMPTDKEKQIEEMREKIRTEISKAVEGGFVTWTEFADWLTEALYNAGYCKQSVGVWIRQKGRPEAICSKCGREVVYQVIDNKWAFENFCPHCGAKMEGVAEIKGGAE